ncbi:hypothetical protein Csa_017872 [Cucumis sativus]|uniref:Uncharacterized protein n=1 Tax=Cucumis sativus TaxID=3659 RepID=A0A0A0KXX1_CUCSA|nr:hypothetical protein Csa_017872 [Cucumis sativus]
MINPTLAFNNSRENNKTHNFILTKQNSDSSWQGRSGDLEKLESMRVDRDREEWLGRRSEEDVKRAPRREAVGRQGRNGRCGLGYRRRDGALAFVGATKRKRRKEATKGGS